MRALRPEDYSCVMAATKKQIVCLANSKKLSGRCVAGVELVGEERGGWIRPVSTIQGGPVPLPVSLVSGEDLQLLDIIEVTLLSHHPDACHVENWLYDATKPWKKVGTYDPGDLGTLVDAPASIWGTGTGWRNSAVQMPESEKLDSSLLLVAANNARMLVRSWSAGDTSVSVGFNYGAHYYEFKVTDPAQKRRYVQKGEGTHELVGPVYVCTSLSEPHDNQRTKLAAAVFTKDGPA